MEKDASTKDAEQASAELDVQLKAVMEEGSSYEVMKSLVQQGANVDTCNSEKRTPIYWAINENDLETIQELIQRDAIINTQDYELETPLHWSVKKNNMPIIKYLLEHGGITGIELKNSYNHTALGIAVQQKNLKVQKLLLGWGAQPIDEATTKRRDALRVKTKRWSDNISDIRQTVQTHVPVASLSNLILEYTYVFSKKPGSIALLDFDGRFQQNKDRSLQRRLDRMFKEFAPLLSSQKDPYEKK